MKISAINGMCLGIMAILMALIFYFTGFERVAPGDISKIGLLPIISIFTYLAMEWRKKKDFGGIITYWQCLRTGLLVALVAGTIMAIFTYLWLDNRPDIVEQMARNAIPKNKEFNESQIRRIFELSHTWAPRLSAFAIFEANLGISIVVSLILSIFIRSKQIKTTPQPIEA
jgi:Protein of unknown function (DUF4199)